MLLRGLRAAWRKATALYDAELAPVGLNIAQYNLLRKIERAGAVSLTALGQLAELDRSTVGRNVRVLERLRFVRPVEAADQREAAVTLAPAGVEALRRAGPLWESAQSPDRGRARRGRRAAAARPGAKALTVGQSKRRPLRRRRLSMSTTLPARARRR